MGDKILCEKCDFNMRGVCAGQYYGEKLKELTYEQKKDCGSFHISPLKQYLNSQGWQF